MSDTSMLEYFGLAIFSFIWVYIAVRMAGRAIVRTLNEYGGKKNGRKDEEHDT